MKVKGITITHLCKQMKRCDECIFNKTDNNGNSPCRDLRTELKDADVPDEYYNALMSMYDLDKYAVSLEILVSYHADITPIAKISVGDWIDLRAAESVDFKAGDSFYISLGVSMKLPEGYEAIVAPRSSLFMKKGLIQANSVGIIDSSYCGDNDIWRFPAYATRDCTVNFNERICQFRILKNQPELQITKVDKLEGENRGGTGSTGGYVNEI